MKDRKRGFEKQAAKAGNTLDVVERARTVSSWLAANYVFGTTCVKTASKLKDYLFSHLEIKRRSAALEINLFFG